MTARYMTVAGFVWCLVGCATIQPVTRPRQFITEKTPQLMWVTNEWNEVLPIAYPQISDGNVMGMWVGMNEHVRIPVERVRNFEAMQFDETRTVLLAAGLAFAVGSIIIFRFSEEGDPAN